MNVATRIQGSAEAVGQGASVDKYMYHRGSCTTFWTSEDKNAKITVFFPLTI